MPPHDGASVFRRWSRGGKGHRIGEKTPIPSDALMDVVYLFVEGWTESERSFPAAPAPLDWMIVSRDLPDDLARWFRGLGIFSSRG